MNYGNNGYECGSFAWNIVKSNEKRDEKQEEREKNYQSVIEKLTEKFEILHQVQSDLSEIKENLFGKHKQE